MSLTHKQAAFCMALAHGSDPAEAWRTVYKAGSLGPRTVEKRARALLDKPAVAAHLAALHADRAAGGAADRAVPLADGAAPDATRAPVAGQPADSLPPKGTASAASTPGTGTPGTGTPGTRTPGPDTSGGSGSLSPSTPGTAPINGP